MATQMEIHSAFGLDGFAKHLVKELKVEQAEGARFYHQGLMVVCFLEQASAKENEQTHVNMWGLSQSGEFFGTFLMNQGLYIWGI